MQRVSMHVPVAHTPGAQHGKPRKPHVGQLPATHGTPVAHDIPQRPQFAGSSDVSTQLPPHGISPIVQINRHIPRTHDVPPAHVIPHAPQFIGSLSTLAHAAPQRMVPAGHGDMQAPPTHTASVGHAREQAPQLLGSLDVSTHRPPHGTDGAMQRTVVHSPETQMSLVAQTSRQLPQCDRSAVMSVSQPSMRLSLQFPRPGTHATPHTPAMQVGTVPIGPVVAHPRPQAPQLRGSVIVFTHMPLHRIGVAPAHPVPHANDPGSGDEHTGVAPLHAFRQRPQWLLSRRLVSHPSRPSALQSANPTGHSSPHCPPRQTARAAPKPGHTDMQCPQFNGSVAVSTHTPLHKTVGAPQDD